MRPSDSYPSSSCGVFVYLAAAECDHPDSERQAIFDRNTLADLERKHILVAKDFIIDPDTIDFNNVLADIDEIRKYNPQRYEMEQLTAIVYEDPEKYICVGYKDLTQDEFWVRGHMPGMPLMPGVVMLEAIAQVCCYCSHKYKLLGDAMVGFGGLEDVRFRDPVLPGSRLIVMCELLKLRKPRLIVCRFQGVVGKSIVVEGNLKGIPIPVDYLKDLQQKNS